MDKLQTFDPPKEEKVEEIPIPEIAYSLQYTKFHKNYKFAIKQFGDKIVKKELPHNMVIGANLSKCKELLGVGYVAQSFLLNGERVVQGLNQYSNHVWMPQINEKETDPMQKIIQVCFNCQSIMTADNHFIPFNRLEKDEEKEKIKRKKKE